MAREPRIWSGEKSRSSRTLVEFERRLVLSHPRSLENRQHGRGLLEQPATDGKLCPALVSRPVPPRSQPHRTWRAKHHREFSDADCSEETHLGRIESKRICVRDCLYGSREATFLQLHTIRDEGVAVLPSPLTR